MAAGREPENIDKEFLRRWFTEVTAVVLRFHHLWRWGVVGLVRISSEVVSFVMRSKRILLPWFGDDSFFGFFVPYISLVCSVSLTCLLTKCNQLTNRIYFFCPMGGKSKTYLRHNAGRLRLYGTLCTVQTKCLIFTSVSYQRMIMLDLSSTISQYLQKQPCPK